MDIIRKPIEEQLAQALEAIPKSEPANIDLSNLSLEFLITYTFIEINIPIKMDVMLVIINPFIASSGRKKVIIGEKNNSWSNTLKIVHKVVNTQIDIAI